MLDNARSHPVRQRSSTTAMWWWAEAGSADPPFPKQELSQRCGAVFLFPSRLVCRLDEHLVRWTGLTRTFVIEVCAESRANSLHDSAGVLDRRCYGMSHLFRGVFHRVHSPCDHLIRSNDLQTGAIKHVIHRTFDASNTRVRGRTDGCSVIEDQLEFRG